MSEEYIIVNEQDEIIGHKLRGTLQPNDIYRVSALWLRNSRGDILLAQRSFTKRHDPGKWGPAVAGTVEKGEAYLENIIKETAEEIGVTKLEFIEGPKQRMRGQHNYFTQWYRATLDQPAEAFIIQKNEVERVWWFSRAELKRELRDHPENYLAGLSWALQNL
jgi:isopentenyl-diphosphate Delta-isomerase